MWNNCAFVGLVQNNKRCTVHGIKIMVAQQTKIHNSYKNTRLNLLKTNAAIWFEKNNFKLYYQQLNLKYLCNLARYWLQAVWEWHNSVETCRSVIICEIIVHLLVIVQNNKRCTVHGIKILQAQQTKIHNNYKNTRLKLLKTNADIWFNKNICSITNSWIWHACVTW